MNIFIGENNLKDYVFLKSIIEKWGIEKQQEIYFHWYKQLYYQLPKCLKNCDLVFLELDMKHINGFEFAKKKGFINTDCFSNKKYTLRDSKLSSTSDALLIKAA